MGVGGSCLSRMRHFGVPFISEEKLTSVVDKANVNTPSKELV